MAIDFPASPTNGQTFTSGSVTYTWDGTKWTAVAAAGSGTSITQGNTTAEVIDTGSDGRFVVTTEGTERLRVDSSGRLGIQTASPRFAISVGSTGSGSTATPDTIDLGSTFSSTAGANPKLRLYWDGSLPIGFGVSNNQLEYIVGNASSHVWYSNGSERARIDSSGRLLVGTSTTAYAALIHAKGSLSDYLLALENTSSGPYGIRIRYSAASPNGASNDFLYCDDSTALRFQVRSNGGLANYSANNVNLSDRNAKKDIALASDTWNCLKEWEIVNFRYKDQPDDSDLNMGVIAQQIAESCPEVITVFQEATEDQPEKLGVKDQQMMWMAIKALQEAQLRIETLEAKVAALESPTTALEIPVDPSSTDT